MSGNEACGAFDMLIVGGGINGAGIARDAAGRGLSVLLVEQDDLAGHTSSASTKLIHGGLRYLEYGEFRLVRESLIERERLWGMAPHIIWPLRFVLPQTQSPRPAWTVRLGLFLYDHMGGRKRLPATETVALEGSSLGEGLADRSGRGFVYSDCWVEDSRLVVLNAMDAAARGARILTRTRLESATREGGEWRARIADATGKRDVRARILVNAAGPWVSDVIGRAGLSSGRAVRLVKGSHIVVPRLYAGDHAFMLQNPDRRIVFAIPYEGHFTLIGTTDQPWEAAPAKTGISEPEARYLIETANRYFARKIGPDEIIWSYAGIRPLHDDKAASAAAATRDYVLDLDNDGPPLLSLFGGKITTYRRLAEHALNLLGVPGAWTAGAVLPGGDLGEDFGDFADRLIALRPDLPAALLRRLARAYGTRALVLLGDARNMADLGELFGGDLSRAEVDYLVANEWARTAEDMLYRRSKLGLHLPAEAAERIDRYLQVTN
ncbi:MAG TPA: glycerol-3-phosphate dehydrogenase [Sphingobium sp.]|nr:glycerol-3-phosphate dehydrogenase [Sphingobium sp.]